MSSKIPVCLFVTVVCSMLMACHKEETAKTVTLPKSITAATIYTKQGSGKEPDYIIDGSIEIKAPVSFDPGVVVVLKKGSQLIIQPGGSLVAKGSTSASVVFKGEENRKGFWRGFVFQSNDTLSHLRYCEILNAGGDPAADATGNAAIYLTGKSRLVLQYTVIDSCNGFGLNILSAEARLDSFSANTFKNCTLGPVMCSPVYFSKLDSTSNYKCSENAMITGLAQAGNKLTVNSVWQKLNVSYLIPAGVLQIDASLKVLPGCRIMVSQGTGILVSATGAFSCVGELSDFIYFEPLQAVKGYWGGIQFNSNSGNKFQYTVLSGGGNASVSFESGKSKANLEVGKTGRLEITSCNIKDSNQYGIYVAFGGVLVDKDNIYSGNTAGNKFIATN